MMRVVWAAAATRDLSALKTYLEQFSGLAAQAEIDRMVLATRWLLDNQFAGPPIGHKDLRKWKPRRARHLLLYNVLADGIEVVRIHHERENWWVRR